MRTILIFAALVVGLALIWYRQPTPPPPESSTVEAIIADLQAIEEVAPPPPQKPQKKFTPASGITSADVFSDRPYFTYYHKWGSRIASSRMGQKIAQPGQRFLKTEPYFIWMWDWQMFQKPFKRDGLLMICSTPISTKMDLQSLN